MQRRQITQTAPRDRTLYQQYTLTDWGASPWPDLTHPSPEECEEIYTRLMEQHGDRLRPVHITAPSLEIAGCGEVPQVLDAIIRTMISANTKFEYADAALKSLISKVGVILDNKGLDATEYPELQQCLDYDHIRTSMSEEDLQDAIKTAGNQKETAHRIMLILADVHRMNKERVDAFRNETADNPIDPTRILAANLLSEQEKQWEIRMLENSILNLEFLKKLSPEHAMNEMLCWKGIGVKTAACVLMFCMQEDILACDTHCIRLSKWLGWVPVSAKDELVFAHVDKMVPNHLKYALHQLFIQHGKDCILCKDDKNEAKEGLQEVVCPLEDLLDRGNIRGYKADMRAKAVAKRQRKAKDKEVMEGKDEDVVVAKGIQHGNPDSAKASGKTRMKRESDDGAQEPVSVEKDADDAAEVTKKHGHQPKRIRITKKPAFASSGTTRQTRSQTKALKDMATDEAL